MGERKLDSAQGNGWGMGQTAKIVLHKASWLRYGHGSDYGTLGVTESRDIRVKSKIETAVRCGLAQNQRAPDGVPHLHYKGTEVRMTWDEQGRNCYQRSV